MVQKGEPLPRARRGSTWRLSQPSPASRFWLLLAIRSIRLLSCFEFARALFEFVCQLFNGLPHVSCEVSRQPPHAHRPRPQLRDRFDPFRRQWLAHFDNLRRSEEERYTVAHYRSVITIEAPKKGRRSSSRLNNQRLVGLVRGGGKSQARQRRK